MATELEFTGERFVPGIDGEIVYEHVHRYAFARALVDGKRVLDAACGEGYGSALLAQHAATVTGVDIDAATIVHARERYRDIGNLSFVAGSVAALPLPDASVDAIVSFETIEHLPAADQPRMLAEFARVLAPGGFLVLSAPNRVEYSERRGFANPFHLHEHDRAEVEGLVAKAFAVQQMFRQRVWLGSTIWREGDLRSATAYHGDAQQVSDAALPEAMYFIVLAAAQASALPGPIADLSLFADAAETELRRCNASTREAMRLDAILGERTAMLDRQSEHVLHLERLVAVRDAIVVERDRLLAEQAARMGQFERQEKHRDERHERDALALRELTELRTQLADAHAAAEAQERIIDYRHSLHWWMKLPWLRLRGEWRRLRDG